MPQNFHNVEIKILVADDLPPNLKLIEHIRIKVIDSEYVPFS